MKVTYKPDGAKPQVWTWDPGDVRQSEAEAIQRRFGGSWDEFSAAVRQNDARARRILLWHFQRQTHPALRYEDTPDFRMRELEVEYDIDELVLIRDRLLRADLDEESRDMALAAVELEISDRMGSVPDPVDVDPGKASNVSA